MTPRLSPQCSNAAATSEHLVSRPRGVPTAIDRCPRICAFAEPGVPSLRMACSRGTRMPVGSRGSPSCACVCPLIRADGMARGKELSALGHAQVNHRDCNGRGAAGWCKKCRTRPGRVTALHRTPSQLTKIVTPSRASVTTTQEHLTPARKRASSDHFARRKQRVASVGCVDTLRT